ncbi:related to purine nucleoside permease [Cephalotrichum gorgonifer]|uniref:Related to purine nucleoside permease n=1 Tax=Cephalotrichum gorgonifer TaxID=2041049 RepID=A0AAE8N7J9_9PEZI|nr:related to purine nucleoside permease [Cephalotrichum gorgonifer]
MPLSLISVFVALLVTSLVWSGAANPLQRQKIAPKVVIISMFGDEAEVWHKRLPDSGLGDLADVQTHVPGLSVQYPHVYCTRDYSICHLTTGMGEINSAATMMALTFSDKFDLRSTYFIVSGIGGVNPKHGTLGSVAIARYAVQVALQYEIDARSIPKGWDTGYMAFGTKKPFEYPTIIYGTEVFELNEALRDVVFRLAGTAELSDSEATDAYRLKYTTMGRDFTPGTQPPAVIKCDAATSDVYYSGALLSAAFEKTSAVWTNGSAEYCMSAQEDNATLEVLVRAAVAGLVDFSRVIVMRAGSNFDRPPANVSTYAHLAVLDQNGFHIAIENLYNTGIEIVNGIIGGWDCVFKKGVAPMNYIGDIFGSLGGEPDFGPGSLTCGAGVSSGGAGDKRTAGQKA